MLSQIQLIAQTPFVQIALPIVITLIVAAWNNNKRFDDVNRRLDGIEARLVRIESKLDEHGTRIAVLEDRSSPLRR